MLKSHSCSSVTIYIEEDFEEKELEELDEEIKEMTSERVNSISVQKKNPHQMNMNL